MREEQKELVLKHLEKLLRYFGANHMPELIDNTKNVQELYSVVTSIFMNTLGQVMLKSAEALGDESLIKTTQDYVLKLLHSVPEADTEMLGNKKQ